MANNCLVTKLKGNVQNDNLNRLNTLMITVKGTNEGNPQWLLVSNSKPFSIYSIGGGFLYNDDHYSGENNPLNLPAGNNFWIKVDTGEYKIFITEKYTLTSIIPNYMTVNIYGYNIDDIKDYTTINTLACTSKLFKGHLESLSTINSFYIQGTNIEGDISCFAGKTLNSPLPSIAQNNSFVIAGSPAITGDIVNLSGINNSLTNVDIQSTGIYGTIESLINAMSRTTGSIKIWITNSKVTYTGKTSVELGIYNVSYNFETGEYTTG